MSYPKLLSGFVRILIPCAIVLVVATLVLFLLPSGVSDDPERNRSEAPVATPDSPRTPAESTASDDIEPPPPRS